MALFSFIKEAGANVFTKKKFRAEEQTEITESRKVEMQQEDQRAAEDLKERILDRSLRVKKLEIEIDGDIATVTGKAFDQANREKIILLVGNTQGIAKVDDQLDIEKPGSEAYLHTVEYGENHLRDIAKQHYNDENKYIVIFEANKPMLEEPGKLYPGQVLRIPQLEKK